MRVGADTGGTFTDVVTGDGRVAKVSTTPEDPAVALARGLEGLAPVDLLAHGTTIATNALLEGRLGRVALVMTAGCEDVIEIARQVRPSLYDPFADRPPPLVGRDVRVGIGGRLDATGREIDALELASLAAIPADLDAIAICLLHADLEPSQERAAAAVLRQRCADVVCSHEASPEMREYERTVTTVLDAALRAPCRPYLGALSTLAAEVLVMTSGGGLVPVDEAAAHPAALLLSGPAGGVRAAAAFAVACGHLDAVSFDMGGTSTDVCLVRAGVPEPAAERSVAGYPVRVPALDVHTIGAGGGSVAALDAGGALVVGPRSAGAIPGPSCYGRGGVEPTVTDADLVLARIDPAAAFPGLGQLDPDAARRALSRAGVDPAGVVRVVDASMERAVRTVTVARGVDPRDLALVAFGGAGPLHACSIAEALGMRTVIVPPRAGALSAVGLLSAPRERELVRSWPAPRDHAGLPEALTRVAGEAAALVPDARVETYVDARYAGQSHEITVGRVEDFDAAHAARNGYARPGTPIEVIALRARARGPAPLAPEDLPATPRSPARGPAIVSEPDCTIWLAPGWVAEIGAAGSFVLTGPR